MNNLGTEFSVTEWVSDKKFITMMFSSKLLLFPNFQLVDSKYDLCFLRQAKQLFGGSSCSHKTITTTAKIIIAPNSYWTLTMC